MQRDWVSPVPQGKGRLACAPLSMLFLRGLIKWLWWLHPRLSTFSFWEEQSECCRHLHIDNSCPINTFFGGQSQVQKCMFIRLAFQGLVQVKKSLRQFFGKERILATKIRGYLIFPGDVFMNTELWGQSYLLGWAKMGMETIKHGGKTQGNKLVLEVR